MFFPSYFPVIIHPIIPQGVVPPRGALAPLLFLPLPFIKEGGKGDGFSPPDFFFPYKKSYNNPKDG